MLACACRAVAACFFIFLPIAAFAQVIPPSEQPGRERERFTEPPTPRAQPGGPAISLPSTVAPPGADKILLKIRGVRIVGSTIYSAEDLAPLYADVVGRQVTLQDVYKIAQRITAKYGADGYVLSRAVVPPQKLDPKGAVVRIEIIEGWINKVEWPASLARYRNFFSDYATRITADRPVNIRTIERYLLLASDLPGLKFATRLRPSETVGASILVVEVIEKPIDAIARVDNRGTPARGPIQFLTSATLNNLFGQHEALTLTWAATSQLKELEYFAANYRQVLTSEGLTAFINGSYGWGRPGTDALELLQYKTRTIYAEAGLSYPVIRARERNLTLSGLGFVSDSTSDIFDTRFNQDNLRGFRFRADADAADPWGGINQLNITYSQGISGLGSSANGDPLASRAAGRVDFSKIEVYASRLQPLFDRFSALLSAYSQYAFTSLLSPEQCGFGGRTFGRAFDPSQLLGDRCFEAVGELRYDLPWAELSQAQIYGFADYGTVYTIAPAVFTPQSTDAASAGSGLRLGWQNNFYADLTAAKAVYGPRNDWRFFFAVTARH